MLSFCPSTIIIGRLCLGPMDSTSQFMKSIATVLYIIVGFSFSTPLFGQSPFEGTWVGILNKKGYEWNVKLHIGSLDKGASHVARISFPDWGMFRLATDSLKISKNEIEFDVLWIDGHFKGVLEAGVLNISWSEWGDAKGSMHRIAKNSDLFRRERVETKTDDGETLIGTIVFPNNDPPFNGMVLTHGSGPDTRTTGAYISKAHLAAEHGLAVLIYDKRGAGESSGSGWSNLSRLTKDALGMVELMRQHKEINEKNVGIGGSSQGAWIAPKAAYSDSDIAFVFTVATPGITPAEQNVYSMETRIESAEDKEFAKEALRYLYEFYRTNDYAMRTRAIEMINEPKHDLKNSNLFQRFTFSNGEIPEESDLGFWSKAMFEDPLVWWKEIKVPVASFSGEDDFNVPTSFSNKLIKACLEESGNPDFELHIFPDADHGLSLNNLEEGDWRRMAEGYVEIMGLWFAKMAQRN